MFKGKLQISLNTEYTKHEAYNSDGCRYIGPSFVSSTGICFFVVEDRRLLVDTAGEGGACDDLVIRGDLEGPAPGDESEGGTLRLRRGVIGEGGVCVSKSADCVLAPATDVDIVSVVDVDLQIMI